ncbi:peptidoglycan DD-metalloendopeptidase family protein [Propioniciclava coleopterorum]|uniref:Peptidoglycan DD-metalloendopeptidase family protein n=1 Tax=Propioniciclava coleopterorum TaxID=2714937 RepID=A0A6G7Y8Z7_9ACTN|nr:M23 family metallopeptidase [Propioniciclava coleopterorum]QIK73250.1 peptidoglycan DD-metalloendopeptidase family protein [Propioniciclava coleopterorum]
MTARQGRSWGTWGIRLASACAAAALTTSLVAPHAIAEDLNTLRGQVKANQDSQEQAKNNVSESSQAVQSATNQLIDSQNQLAAAQSALADVQVQLSAARENDARLASELATARAELEAAKQRVIKAQAEVDAQLRLIGSAARESYQQQTDLRDLTVVFGSETPAELSQRLQWNTTIFDSQAATKSRLDAVRDELEGARQAQAAAEARVAAEKADAAKVVAQIARLERQAEQQRATVSGLVSANEQARAAAQGELDADEAAYRTLVSDEQRLEGEIQAELARIRAEEQERARIAAEKAAAEKAAAERAAAEKAAAAKAAADKAAASKKAADRAAADKAAAEAKAAAAKAAASKPSQATGSGSSGGTGKATSASGFIRPINANPGSPFGKRFHPILKYWRNHNGNDWGAKTGTPIYAAKAGTVMKAGPNGGFGNFVMIGHGDDAQGRFVTTGYAHMSKVVARVGQKVQQGQLIGYVGSTGLSTTPHLHLEVRLDGRPVNPMLYIP